MNAKYFEAGLLKENERSVEWLLDKLRPESSRKDRLLLRSITGFDYGNNITETLNNDEEGDEENTEKEVSNFNDDAKFGQ